MSVACVEVTAPSRLHFGMFSFGHPGTRQFGGVGVMIDEPGLRLRMTRTSEFRATGPLADRVKVILDRLREQPALAAIPACHIEVVAAPPDHVGLGTGTQLSLAVAAGCHALAGGSPLSAEALARLTGRGVRSAIGTYGFVQGGLLVEPGKLVGELLSPLEHRVALPAEWRFVLITPATERGLSGEAEQMAFRDLPAVPPEVSETLRREVIENLVPAAQAGDIEQFGQSVYRFGHAAGLCFAARQGGAFASPRIAMLVDRIRELGVAGVGQTSWGPTVFAVAPNQDAAEQLIDRLAIWLTDADRMVIARANSSGATIRLVSDP